MKKARLTTDGARRIGYPHLAGKQVEYDKIHELGTTVENVYRDGNRIAGVLSIVGKTPGLIIEND